MGASSPMCDLLVVRCSNIFCALRHSWRARCRNIFAQSIRLWGGRGSPACGRVPYQVCLFVVLYIRQSCVRPLSWRGIMATPRSVVELHAGVSGREFDKTGPKFPVEVRTTIRGCLSATRHHQTPGRKCSSCNKPQRKITPQQFCCRMHYQSKGCPQGCMYCEGGAGGIQRDPG
jgi:hypothetical protein